MNFCLLFLFIVIVNTIIIMTWIMMVRRHVTATLSIVDSEGLEQVFSTSFLHCSYILRHSWTSDWIVQLTVSNLSLIVWASENIIHILHYILLCVYIYIDKKIHNKIGSMSFLLFLVAKNTLWVWIILFAKACIYKFIKSWLQYHNNCPIDKSNMYRYHKRYILLQLLVFAYFYYTYW